MVLIVDVGRIKGSVRVASELWTAVSDSGKTIPEGEEVIVLDREGLTLKVFKAPNDISVGG